MVKTVAELAKMAVKELKRFEGFTLITEDDQDQQCAGSCTSCELESADECQRLIEELC